ncbi:unnamed protein product [Somion occarium]|uniref:Mak10-domain-containing protein n=1 Tax=Somion occarium TaxID=3059160 RepID=A0ABP1D612_9APHY
MSSAMDIDVEDMFDMPGGNAFEDVTELFEQAASDMAPGDVLLSEGFTLFDSMGAFEIGEPRMDSGMIVETTSRPTFDPLTPLLPEEVCWIIDRGFACEMEWHSGSTLSQTVYTLLYVHHLSNIDPDFLLQVSMNEDPHRPLGLLTIVLRAAVMGMLKCCDLAWREMSQNNVQDTEDWQSEKCEVSLLEGVPVEYVVQKLEAACSWLRSSSIPIPQRDALIDRLLLRKALLELFRLDLSQHRDKLRPFLVIALNELHKVQHTTISTPPPDSPALLAIDPSITRRLPNFIPIRVVALPSQEKVWQTISELLDGLNELDHLLDATSLSAWETIGSLRNWSPQRTLQPPYIRSRILTCFFDNTKIAHQYPQTWLIDRFWLETFGMSWDQISSLLHREPEDPQLSIERIELHTLKMVIRYVKAFWFNPPRRRRCLMKLQLDYSSLHRALKLMTSKTIFEDPGDQAIAKAIPLVPTFYQLRIALDIILSGFQQELYAQDERPIAYYYAAQVLELYLAFSAEVSLVVPDDNSAISEMEFWHDYYQERLSVNFKRRYKWLFTKTFPNNVEVKVLPLPDLDVFFSDAEMNWDSTHLANTFKEAKNYLVPLTETDVNDLWAPAQAKDRIDFVRALISVCDNLQDAAQSDVNRDSAGGTGGLMRERLRWDPTVHPWFPCLKQDT